MAGKSIKYIRNKKHLHQALPIEKSQPPPWSVFCRRSWLILEITATHNKPLDSCRYVCIIIVKATRPQCHCAEALPTYRSVGLFALLLSVVLGLNGSSVSHCGFAGLQGCFHSTLWLVPLNISGSCSSNDMPAGLQICRYYCCQ